MSTFLYDANELIVLRGPGFNDNLMVNIIPPANRPPSEGDKGLLKSDLICKDSQKTPTQTDKSPRLQAAPGSFVALRYQENGHVTLPQTQLGKPPNRGNVFIYGTSQPSETDTLLAIHKQWNSAGTGGDKRGKLLATQPYDDARCYQINGGEISVARQNEFPHEFDPLMGENLWCQNDIALPSDLPVGEKYTLYWVWDWPTAPNVDPGLPNGKEEIYTTCMDIDIADKPEQTQEKASADAPSDDKSNLNNAAIPQYMKELLQGSDSSSDSTKPKSQAPSPTKTAKAPTSEPSNSQPKAITVTVAGPPVMQPTTVTVMASKAQDSIVNAAPVLPASPTTLITVPSPATTTTTTIVINTVLPLNSEVPSQPIKSFSGTASALPASTASVVSPGSASSPRCIGCKEHRRSRIFGAARKHKL